MEIKNLKVFSLLADGATAKDVADRFGITRSAISKIMSALERELGAELFVHGTSQLTECGALFLATARRMVAAYDEGLHTMQSLRDDVSGDLRIGVGSFVEPVIRKAVAKLLRDYPDLRVDAHVYRSNTLNQLLRSGKLDVAFTLNKAYEGEGIVSEPCIPVRIMAVMSRTHVLAKKERVTFEDVCHHDCILPTEDRRAFATVAEYLGRNIADLSRLRSRVKINTADGALNMVEEENFLTFMTRPHIVNRPNLVAIPIEGLDTDILSNMHTLEAVHPKTSVAKLRQVIEEYAVPLMRITSM